MNDRHPDVERDLDQLLDEFVLQELDDQPVRATALGVEGYDDRLGDFSAPAWVRRQSRDRQWLARFEAFPDGALDLDRRLDRDLVISTLRGRIVMHDWEGWRRRPDPYLEAGLYGVFYLFLHRLRPEAELVEDAVARLEQVPGVLADARANLDAEVADRLMVERALGQCRAGVLYARTLVPAEAQDPVARARLGAAGETAASAFEEFATFLEGLASSARGSFAIGEARYSALLREQEGLAFGAGELHERGRAAYDAIASEMARRARELEGTDDFRAVIEALNDDHPATPEEMLARYREWTERARQFLADRELVTFPPGEECLVEPSPPFQRPVLAVASYSRPPAFTPSRRGHFFVPFPPEGAPADDVARRLRTNAVHTIPAIAVHEAYPGHHWHLATLAGNPRSIRKVLGTSYFSEGWGLYSENMMREQGFFPDPRQELCQLDMRMFRAARIVVDTALHGGEMSPGEATTFMMERAGLSEPVARTEVMRYCAWPTQAASYLTGCLEIERIRDRYLAQRQGTLRDFHDALAYSGALPLSLAERAVLA